MASASQYAHVECNGVGHHLHVKKLQLLSYSLYLYCVMHDTVPSMPNLIKNVALAIGVGHVAPAGFDICVLACAMGMYTSNGCWECSHHDASIHACIIT